MSHTEAMESNAVERYLLGEMNDDQRQTFEDHYFDCRLCAADVTDGMLFMSAGRGVAREAENNVRKFAPRATRWFPQAAAAAVLAVSLLGNGYLALVKVPRMAEAARESEAIVRKSEVMPLREQQIRISQIRGPEAPEQIRPGTRISVDIPPREDAVSYVLEVRDRDGKLRGTEVPATRKQAKEPFSMWIGSLPADRYELVIRGVRKDGNRFEIATRSFIVVGER